jgi:PKD repeat protein
MLKKKIKLLVILLVCFLASSELVSAASTIEKQTPSKPYFCDFKADNTVCWAPFDATIKAKTNIPDGDINSWQWTVVPNPITSARYWTQSTPWMIHPHMFKSGDFAVYLKIFTKSGQSIVCEKSDYITVYKNEFRSDALVPSNPKIITFKYSGTGNPTMFNWNFGDKTTSKQKNSVTHTYKKPGTYTVSLNVKNHAGSNTVSKEIAIK